MSVAEREDEWAEWTTEPTEAEIAWLYGENGRPELEKDSWIPRNLALAPDAPLTEPTLGGIGLLYPGKRHVFSGPQESAKTLAAYVAGLCVVREGGRLMLIDFEMGEIEAKRRLRELGATDEELGAIDYIEPEEKITPLIAQRLVQCEPSLVIVDASAGAYDLQGLDDNKRQDVERFARLYVNGFWKAGIATIVLDHVTKNVEARGNYAIGSERKVGGTDVHLGFEVVHPIKRGGHGLYKIMTHKDRGGCLKRGKLAEFELTSDPDSHQIEWAFKAPVEADEEHSFRPTHLMEKVSRYVELQLEPVPRSQVEKNIEGKAQYVREALDLLTSEGFVSESKGLKNARLVESEIAYRESGDLTAFSSSPVRPQFVPDVESTARLSSSPPIGDEQTRQFVPKNEFSSSQRSLDEDDGIPF